MKLRFIFLMLTMGTFARAQQTNLNYRYAIKPANFSVNIDGVADEEGWRLIDKIPNLMNHWPMDTGMAQAKTEVQLTFDKDFLYLMARCYDNGTRIIQSLKRDNLDGYWNSDNLSLLLDPMNSRQNGIMFGVNAGGAQMEALVNSTGVNVDADANWDNKWYSAVKQYPDHWLIEMAIPFKTLRYDPSSTEWSMNIIRGDLQRNVYSTWTQFPLNYDGISLNFLGSLDWPKAPEPSKGNIVLIPYMAGGTQRDFEDEKGQTSYKQTFDTGLDAKIAVTSSLNLDLTLNPDFSNVDVDQQVTNLSRFSIFFPERRNFFLENADLFSNFGTWEVQPFFSRQIGLNKGEQIPILYGARLTGNLNPRLRLGLMNLQTRESGDFAANNYSVAAVHQRVLKNSVIKAIFMNRQSTGVSNKETDFARNGGLEFQYVHPNGKWNNAFLIHASQTDEKLGDNMHLGITGEYQGRHLRSGWVFDRVGENYITELGFNPRLYNYNAVTEETTRSAYTRVNPWLRYIWYPSAASSSLNMHGLRTWHMAWLNEGGSLNERGHGVGYDFIFKNTSEMRFNRLFKEVNLPVPTNFIDSGNPLPASNYKFTEYWVNYNTDQRKLLSTDWRIGYGDFYNGQKFNFSGGLNLRTQPWGSFGVNYTLNRVELAEGFGETTLHLLRANVDISFSNSMFWTTAVQYNSQSENYNVFSRFQWRFKPMSDFFLVYTDNYTTDGLNIKNRQIVFKITYWFNM